MQPLTYQGPCFSADIAVSSFNLEEDWHIIAVSSSTEADLLLWIMWCDIMRSPHQQHFRFCRWSNKLTTGWLKHKRCIYIVKSRVYKQVLDSFSGCCTIYESAILPGKNFIEQFLLKSWFQRIWKLLSLLPHSPQGSAAFSYPFSYPFS